MMQNEARLLRDENIIKLIEGSDRVNSTKVLLRRIMEQHNLAQLDTM